MDNAAGELIAAASEYKCLNNYIEEMEFKKYLKLILDSFGVKIPAKLYRSAELKSIKTEIKIFM